MSGEADTGFHLGRRHSRDMLLDKSCSCPAISLILKHEFFGLTSSTSLVGQTVSLVVTMSGSKEYAKRIPDSEWDLHERTIRRLYIQEAKPLTAPGGVQEIMFRDFEFSAT